MLYDGNQKNWISQRLLSQLCKLENLENIYHRNTSNATGSPRVCPTWTLSIHCQDWNCEAWLLYHMISNHMLVFHIIYKLQMWDYVLYQTLEKNSWQCKPRLPQTHKLQMLPISVVSCSCGQILEEKRTSLEKSPNQSIQLSRLKLWANKYGDE